jgi:hypothetical protein
MDGAAEDRDAARIRPRQVFGANATRGTGSIFIDRAILKEDQRFPGFNAVERYRLVVNAAVHVRLQVRAHHAMDGAGKNTEDHSIRMMNPLPRDLKSAALRDFSERVFDGLDHLVQRKNLIDRSILQKQHEKSQLDEALLYR